MRCNITVKPINQTSLVGEPRLKMPCLSSDVVDVSFSLPWFSVHCSQCYLKTIQTTSLKLDSQVMMFANYLFTSSAVTDCSSVLLC